MSTRNIIHRCTLFMVGLLLGILIVSCTTSTPVAPVVTVTNIAPGVVKDTPLPEKPTATPAPLIPTENIPDVEVKINPTLVNDYLTNPGMGWQDGPEPYGITDFPGTVAYANRRDIAWSELNPAGEEYHWEPLNAQLEDAVENGKQFSFRIYTFVGEDYDGSKIPDWVMDAGAQLLSNGEPDYSNCVYQEEWGKFINELVRTYDGNPDIAFIDISGYGNFNEWSWQDAQTEWDDQWDMDYIKGTPYKNSFLTLDGQARRRLVDIFIGGDFQGHECRMPDGTTATVDYNYPGFKKTQLVMPYAGIVQSTQYAYSRSAGVGFRYDCLGREGRHVFRKVGVEIMGTWKNAPVIYELCKPDETDPVDAAWMIQKTHASIVHNNQWSHDLDELEKLMLPAGFRYFLKEIDFKLDAQQVDINMTWQNIGLAPNYPKMGQEFALYLYLIDPSGRTAFKEQVPADISTWMPAEEYQHTPPDYSVSYTKEIPSSLAPGEYQVGVSIIDTRTGEPIQLAFEGSNENGIYILLSAEIK